MSLGSRIEWSMWHLGRPIRKQSGFSSQDALHHSAVSSTVAYVLKQSLFPVWVLLSRLGLSWEFTSHLQVPIRRDLLSASVTL
jgi:hypothetical protein